jgi:hypothetical protein
VIRQPPSPIEKKPLPLNNIEWNPVYFPTEKKINSLCPIFNDKSAPSGLVFSFAGASISGLRATCGKWIQPDSGLGVEKKKQLD